ncbi:chorismate mutase [Natronospora cellulosivora (SeqCode)]
MRAIRGAITVEEDKEDEVLQASEEILKEIINENDLQLEEFVSVTFTATADIKSVYPAVAARKLGLDNVPLLCFQEMKVENSLRKCIRIMVYINRDCKLDDIKHVYLRKAVNLRPDLNN